MWFGGCSFTKKKEMLLRSPERNVLDTIAQYFAQRDAVADREAEAPTRLDGRPLMPDLAAALAAIPESPSRPAINLVPLPPRGTHAPHALPLLRRALLGQLVLRPSAKRDDLAPLRVRPTRIRRGSQRLGRPRSRRGSARARSPGRPDDDPDLADHHGYPVVRVEPEPQPTLLAGSVAAVLADLGGPELAAEALGRALRDLTAAEAEERLADVPALMRALLSESAS
jgi:hypothetical protein